MEDNPLRVDGNISHHCEKPIEDKERVSNDGEVHYADLVTFTRAGIAKTCKTAVRLGVITIS